MSRFNLSSWAVTHPALLLFLLIMLSAAGAYSYTQLGRAEDPGTVCMKRAFDFVLAQASSAETEHLKPHGACGA